MGGPFLISRLRYGIPGYLNSGDYSGNLGEVGSAGMSALIGKFRSARYRQLAEMAIAQEFLGVIRGSGHYGLICPECGTCIILSTTQRDNADYKYLNQVGYLRRHGLEMPGRKSKGCQYV